MVNYLVHTLRKVKQRNTMERITKIMFQIFAFISVFLFANAGELLIMLMALYFPLMILCVKIDRLMLKY